MLYGCTLQVDVEEEWSPSIWNRVMWGILTQVINFATLAIMDLSAENQQGNSKPWGVDIAVILNNET